MVPILVKLGIFVATIEIQKSSKESGYLDTPTIPEQAFLKDLSKSAHKLALDLFVFSPSLYNPHTGQISGFRYQKGRWVQEHCELPDIIYDRCFYSTAEERNACLTTLASLTEQKPFIKLNGGLPSKWDVYLTLKNFSRLAPILPDTEQFVHSDRLKQLFRYNDKGLFLKPASGMQGKGVLYIRQCLLTQQWLATGRTRHNRSFHLTFDSYAILEPWVKRFVGKASYIVQPYLELSDSDNKPFDVRVLLQKDENARWSLTGTAVRIGQQGTLTSNLHGGGTALCAIEHLTNKFGKAKADKLIHQMKESTIYAAEKLENSFGRLAELGFDFGIEPSGRIWLLEVNAKPGRASFQQLGDQEAEQQSVERPLRYARLLSRRLYPFFITNESAIDRLRYHSQDVSDNVQEVHL